MSHEDHHRTNDVPESVGIDRREFLKLAGFSFAGVMLAGCQQGTIEKAIPFLVQPEEITPGLSYWYATTCGGCNAGCGVLSKNRDGRPVKLEGNPAHPLSKGGLCAMGQASLLSLYDSQRLKNPLIKGKEATWNEVDAEVLKELDKIKSSGGRVRVLTGTISSPTTLHTIERFLSAFADARHIQYDPISAAAILAAHNITHGRRILPHYRLDRAKTIVSFDADFLGTWISPVEFTADYRAGRHLDGKKTRFSYHAQLESRFSLTGSNADDRIAVPPMGLSDCLRKLAALIAQRAGRTLAQETSLPSTLETTIEQLAERLWTTRGNSVVLCGVNNLQLQLLTNSINEALGNYGATVDIDQPSYQYNGNDRELQQLLGEVQQGNIAALFVAGVNPVYDLPAGEDFGGQLAKIPLMVSFAGRVDETAAFASFVCPETHALETWTDAEPVAGLVAITQPVTQPLRNTRHVAESFSAWTGAPQKAYDLLRMEWRSNIFKRQSGESSFENFWNIALQNGFVIVSPEKVPVGGFDHAALQSSPDVPDEREIRGSVSLVLFPSMTMLDGRHAHNPWLHELPDPITKIVWDNYASLAPAMAARLGVTEGDSVRIAMNGAESELPAHIQTGQVDDVVAIPLGYGRKGTNRFTDIGPSWLQARPTVQPGELVGKNAAPFLRFTNDLLTYGGQVTITTTGRRRALAATQEYNFLREPNLLGKQTEERRPIIQETTLAAYLANPAAGSFPKSGLDSMWPDDHTYPGHHWGMVIDLSACTGCSACLIACQAENNIPVVGKDEVRRNRELTWIRIDRYYDEDDGLLSVSHQPMMCQQCGNAPCETVCPVLATVHNDEGLNQQIYNRCVGTRYCANNCPYKVRHFNWFQYPRGDAMEKMVLNPDVTVRDRGVMEKCSFCSQRIQLAKMEAKRDGRTLADGDIQPACAQSCPAKAISFGDMNDPESTVARQMKDPRYYRVLDELGIKPSVGYMTLVRNRNEEDGRHG